MSSQHRKEKKPHIYMMWPDLTAGELRIRKKLIGKKANILTDEELVVWDSAVEKFVAWNRVRRFRQQWVEEQKFVKDLMRRRGLTSTGRAS